MTLWPTPQGHNPKKEWLYQPHPQLSLKTPMIIDRDGRVSVISHDYQTPHLDHKDADGRPFFGFKSPTKNRWFHQVQTITDEGEMVAVGNIPYGGGHKINGTFEERKEYKGDPNRVKIRGRAVELDEYVAICGYLVPGTTEDEVHAMLGSPLSPEFLKIGGQMDFIGPEFVDTTAMPIGGHDNYSQEEYDAAFAEIAELISEGDTVLALDGEGDLVYASKGAMADRIKQQYFEREEAMYKQKLEKIEAILASREEEEKQREEEAKEDMRMADEDILARLNNLEGQITRFEARLNETSVPDTL